jgi:hypothetical protein
VIADGGINSRILELIILSLFCMGFIMFYLSNKLMPDERIVLGLPLFYLFSFSFVLTLIIFEIVEGMVWLLNLFL